MGKKVPENYRLRPLELFFAFLGVSTAAALAVLWYRVVPELMAQQGLGPGDLSGAAAAVMHLGVQIPVLLGGLVVLAAGAATRVGSGKARATWILAGGSTAMFAVLLLSINALYEPIFASSGGPAADAADAVDAVDAAAAEAAAGVEAAPVQP